MDLHVFFDPVARLLSGDPYVVVRFKKPSIMEFDGVATKIGDRHVIDIDSEKSDMGMVGILCHECAHIRLGHIEQLERLEAQGEAMYRMDPNAEPGSLSLGIYGLNAYKNSTINSQLEAEAEALCDKWLNFADQHMKDYSIYREDAERRLLALLKWVDTEPQEIEAWKRKQLELADKFARQFKKRSGLKNVQRTKR